MSASAPPFAPPIGSSAPPRAAFGSVVALPSASTAQSAGIVLPAFSAATIFPRAATDIARSMTSGGWAPGRGAAKARGLVPSIGLRPPQNAIAFGELPSTIAISPRSARRSAWAPAWPKWCERCTAATAMPCSRVSGASAAIATSIAG